MPSETQPELHGSACTSMSATIPRARSRQSTATPLSRPSRRGPAAAQVARVLKERVAALWAQEQAKKERDEFREEIAAQQKAFFAKLAKSTPTGKRRKAPESGDEESDGDAETPAKDYKDLLRKKPQALKARLAAQRHLQQSQLGAPWRVVHLFG